MVMTASQVRVVNPNRAFARHYLEMVLAMFVGMAVLGLAVSGTFSLLGHSNLLHYTWLRALLMAGYMVAGMSLWMLHRGHGRRLIGEMAVAMVLPYVLVIGPFLAEAISKSALLIGEHVLMFPFMFLAMWLRREEYSMPHRRHETGVTARPERTPRACA
jgi:hypothetical protein